MSDERVAELEAQLAASRHEVRETREMFQLAMDSIPSCIWWKDTEGRYLGANRNLVVAAGRQTVSELIGKTDLDLWGREDALKYRLDDQRVMDNDRAEYGLLETQKRSDGSVYYLETNKVPLRDSAGRVIGSLGTFNDVTERQMMQEELRRHRDELELLIEERTSELEEEIRERQDAQHQLAQQAQELVEANQALRDAERAKSAFFANVSHELRTPLTLILAPLESALAGSYGDLDTRMSDALRTVYNSAVRLLELVNSILDVSRLEAGRFQANRAACDVDQLLQTILVDFVWLADKRSQKLRWDLCGGQARFLDPYLLERIIFNLVSNALKFTPEGGLVQVRCEIENDVLSLSVADNGIGIAVEDQQHLFRKFHQVESSFTRRYEGTGLGLAMVREFAELLGGGVEVQSAVGEGSTFTVRFPTPPADEPAPLQQPSSRPPAAPTTSWHACEEGDGPDLLIAEDNEELARYVAGLLHPLGRVRWARDGEVALKLALERKPALIVSDVMMPNRDGMWLCREITKVFPEEPPPIILLTALSDRKALLDGWDAGASDFLHKPFHPVELTTRVRCLLQAREARIASAEERRKLEERLFQSQKLDSLGLMAGGIAHDFNNLLAVVVGNLELAEDLYELPQDALDCVREAAGAANRAAGLSRQMLTYVGKAASKTESVDLADMAQETVRMLERRLLPKPFFQLDLSEALVEADRSQIGQVMLNLITNAAEAAPENRKTIVHVRTGVRHFSAEFLDEDEGGSYAYLQVEDNGCGMDAEVLKRIFDPFFSTKFTGRGLGLAAVQGIMRSHKAKCRTFSEPGVGTTFWVLFQPSRAPNPESDPR